MSDETKKRPKQWDWGSAQKRPVKMPTTSSQRYADYKRNYPQKIVKECVSVWHSKLLAKRLETLDKPLKLAAFDMDSTVIASKSGHTYARGSNDWKFLENVEAKIKDASKTHLVVIFTNQGSVIPNIAKKSLQILDRKLNMVIDALPEISLVIAACRNPEIMAEYRKPAGGMFQVAKDELGGIEIDIEHSYFVGDAAGRPGDHSADDKGFAKTVGFPFFTPEEYFLGQEAKSDKFDEHAEE